MLLVLHSKLLAFLLATFLVVSSILILRLALVQEFEELQSLILMNKQLSFVSDSKVHLILWRPGRC